MNRRSIICLAALLFVAPLAASADECGTKSMGPVSTNFTLQASDFSDPWSGECSHEILLVTTVNHVTITLPDTSSVATVFLSVRHDSGNGSFSVVASPNDGGQVLATAFTTRARFANFVGSSARRWHRVD